MTRTRLYLATLALVLGLVWFATHVAHRLGWDADLTVLGALVLASAAASLALAIQRRALRRKLREQDPSVVELLATLSEDIKYAFPAPASRPSWLVTAVGVACVCLPTVPLLVGPVAALQYWFRAEPPYPQFLALGVGLAAAWLWWSVAASLWRRWAERQGMSAGEVQYHGERASVLLPRGHFLERTEWGRWRAKRGSRDDSL